jgi:hypothetical protein
MRITAIHYLFTLTLSLLYPLLAADKTQSIEELKQKIIKHQIEIVSLSKTLSHLKMLETTPPSSGEERPENLSQLILETEQDLMAENTILLDLLEEEHHNTTGAAIAALPKPSKVTLSRQITVANNEVQRLQALLPKAEARDLKLLQIDDIRAQQDGKVKNRTLKEAPDTISALVRELAELNKTTPPTEELFTKLREARLALKKLSLDFYQTYNTHFLFVTPRAETPPKPSYMKTNTPETASTLKAPDVQKTPGEPQTKEVEKKLKRTKSIRSMDELRLPPPLDGLQERDSSAF